MRRQSGILIFSAIGLMLVSLILAFMLSYVSRHEDVSATQIFRSEALTAMAESVVEELVVKIREQLNEPSDANQLYYKVREPTRDDMELDAEYLRKLATESIAMLKEEFEIPPEDVVIKCRITKIQPFDVPGTTDDSVRDDIEKDAQLEFEVSIRWKDSWHDQYRTIVISRPFKVVKCVMPVMGQSTLFVNNPEPINFALWPSVYGYDPARYPAPQPTLMLDHGWHKYSKFNKKSDFIRLFETEVIPKAAVPPGRVFIQKGIVPITNGDRATGALQKTFHSAESELLPNPQPMPLKNLREMLKQQGMAVGPGHEAGASPAPSPAPGPPGGDTQNPSATTGAAAQVPEDGELFIRFAGHGEEIKKEKVKVGDKELDAFGIYFASFLGAWENAQQSDPALSGLDLFGRVTEKEKGSTFEGQGIFARIAGLFQRATSAIMDKLYGSYSIRISPTLVYGEVVHTYFPLVDYVSTGWWEKMQNTFSMNPNQTPLPHFSAEHLARLDPAAPISSAEQLPNDWSQSMKEKWLKLPEDIRKPQFYKIINETLLKQPDYGIDTRTFGPMMTPGSLFAPCWEGLINYLVPEEDSPIKQAFANLADKNQAFLSNEADREYGLSWGAYSKQFSLPLKEFNPFLYYVKATDFISAIYDPRNPSESTFIKKYYNDEEQVFEFDGIIYITGTEPLVLGNAKYRGKAIIITFGKVIFNGPFIKEELHEESGDTKKISALTFVTLGGAVFDTAERVDCQVYSFIFPPLAGPGREVFLYGGMGCNALDLERLLLGGRIVYDWSYHIPPEMSVKDKAPYYYVAITDEIAKFGYQIKRDTSAFSDGAAP